MLYGADKCREIFNLKKCKRGFLLTLWVRMVNIDFL